jgi:hypothetical protein
MNDKNKKDHPLLEVMETAERVIKDGGFIIQKWTCGGCGQRIFSDNVNRMCPRGHCHHCQHVTDLTVTGCNFAAIMPSFPMTVAEVEKALGLKSTTH